MGNKAPRAGSPPENHQQTEQEPMDAENTSDEEKLEQASRAETTLSEQERVEELDSQSEVNESSDTSDSDSETEDEKCVYEGPPVSYKLSLCCSTDDSLSANKRLVIPHTPRIVRELKQCVENQHSIPIVCQSLSFEDQELLDNQTMEELYIRDQDRLVVSYPTKGNVKEVKEIIASIVTMTRFLRRASTKRIILSGNARGNTELAAAIDDNQIDLLPSIYFHSTHTESSANRLFFVTNNGLDTMHRLHMQLLEYQWDQMSLGLMKTEHTILRTLWNLSAAFNIRMLLFERPTLDAVMRSLERATIPANTFIEPPGPWIADPTLRHSVTISTCETVYKAIGTIGNLAEIPRCRVSIASSEIALNQLLGCLTCPSYNKIASIVSSAGLLCLAYSPETHQYLLTDKVINKFQRAINRRDYHQGHDLLLRYFSCLFFAQLLYHSQSYISGSSQLAMLAAMNKFFSEVDYEEVRECEEKDGYVWSTVAPLLKLAYLPWQSPQRMSRLPIDGLGDKTRRQCAEDLDNLCAEAGVFSLQNMLLSQDTRDILVEEGLVDYIVCLPWHVKPVSSAWGRAMELRAFLATKLQLQPPSLLNIAKAKLAVTQCGLETVLEARSLHDIVQNTI